MRANVLTDWERLEMREVPRPVPAEGEVLIRVLLAACAARTLPSTTTAI